MKRILTTGGLIAASICGVLAAAHPAAAQTPANGVTANVGTARCTSPLDGTWTAGWLMDATSETGGNTWVLTSPDLAVTASPSSSTTTLVPGYLEVVTTASSISVDWTATFAEGDSVSGTTPTVEQPAESCEPSPPTDGLEYTLACSQFEAARFLVLSWQDGVATGTETISLASGTYDESTGEYVGGQYPPDLVDVSFSTPTGSYAFPVQIPEDELCGPTRTVVTTTTTTTTTTIADTTTTTTTTMADTTTTVAEVTTTTDNASGAATTTTSPTLPETGSESTGLMTMAALTLMGIGAAAIGATRRREV